MTNTNTYTELKNRRAEIQQELEAVSLEELQAQRDHIHRLTNIFVEAVEDLVADYSSRLTAVDAENYVVDAMKGYESWIASAKKVAKKTQPLAVSSDDEDEG